MKQRVRLDRANNFFTIYQKFKIQNIIINLVTREFKNKCISDISLKLKMYIDKFVIRYILKDA
jgi:hypothetical protein